MDTRVQILVKDRMMEQYADMKRVETFTIVDEDFFLDGPVSRQVAVLDLDPVTGQLATGCRFQTPADEKKLGAYPLANPDDLNAAGFMQVSVFGTILKTIQMFQQSDTLGRPLTWAFNGTQLLVIPRAGEWANAFYDRDSHSLQLFFIQPPAANAQPIYASLSHDIVVHETAHAILDGIAPDLYNSITPQSLAIHEAVADLTALISAFKSRVLPRYVLDRNNGSIGDSTLFSGMAPEFQKGRDPKGVRPFLRNLLNNKTLDPKLDDDFQDPNHVVRTDPHQLSEVLSGAFYTTLVKSHNAEKQKAAPKKNMTEFQVSGFALFVAADRMKRMLFRALDYLPPGEVSFADYGRAILAADTASHPGPSLERDSIVEEFTRRFIVPDAAALNVETGYEHDSVKDLDLETLVNSDWAAYEFANTNRDFLGIPARVPFQVRPRLDVTKKYYLGGDNRPDIRECLFKVSWSCPEPNTGGLLGADQRLITVGTTLAIDWTTKKVRAKLTTDLSEQQRRDRDAAVKVLANAGAGPSATEVTNGVLRFRATARALHMTAGEGAPAVSTARPMPPPGVDASAFYNLLDRRSGKVSPGNHSM